jgi:hypothetical protein
MAVMGEVRSHAFFPMLAKIAHSFAIATWGERSFNPLLPDMILGRDSRWLRLVGGFAKIPPATAPETIHILHVGLRRSHVGVQYVIARVRLFSNFGSPEYLVVVGEYTGTREDPPIAS